jgi:heme exporter protein C
MLWPLMVMALAFTLLAVALHLTAMRAEIMRRRLRTLAILEADRMDREARVTA